MIRKFILLICFSSCLLSFANKGKSIPGYLGSKNAASIKIQPNFALSENLLRQLIRPSLGLTYERVINRRSSFTIGFGSSKNSIGDSAYYPFEERGNYLILDNSVYPSSYYGYINYNNTYLSISKSYYNLLSGSIAPMGFYTKIGYTLNLQKITEDNLSYKIGPNPNGNSQYKTQYTSSFNIEFGSKRFINKNIFIQKSVAFNLPFNFWSTSNYHNYNNIEDYNETNLNFYLSKARTLNFSIGVGAAF